MTRITSVQNERVKAVAGLRDRRSRERQGRIVVHGAREVGRALAAGLPIVEAYGSPELCLSPECRHALGELERAGVPLHEVTANVFARMAYGDRHDGLLAVAQPRPRTLAELAPTASGLVAVLEGVEKPGNVGAVLRSADAAGVAAVIVAEGVTDLYNPNAIRASLGTIFSLPIAEASSADALAWLQARQLPVYAARVGAERLYTEADLAGPAAVVLGSEASGLSPAWDAPDVVAISLPMHGLADSLNVSATAAVLFYEALRQRSARPGAAAAQGEGSG
jgi:TrmH family RNA methyltransferase